MRMCWRFLPTFGTETNIHTCCSEPSHSAFVSSIGIRPRNPGGPFCLLSPFCIRNLWYLLPPSSICCYFVTMHRHEGTTGDQDLRAAGRFFGSFLNDQPPCGRLVGLNIKYV